MSIILVSSVIALYTGEKDSGSDDEIRITSKADLNNSQIEKAKRVMEKNKEQVMDRVFEGIENSNLSEEEKQRIMNNIQTRINNVENMISIKAQKGKDITSEEKRELFQERNKLQIRETMEEECPNECYCAGSTIRCWNKEGKEMTINAGESGNTIIKTQYSNMTTNVTLYHHDGRVFGNYKENKTIALNYLPDEVDERIRERIKARTQERKIELDEEDGNYSIQAKKRARLFGFIPVNEKVEMKMNPETGDILREKNSWWGFLARDIKE
ncbi:MAG: hypothetical protein ACOC1K_06720 [Nanoarchaeota archaeon]